MSAPGSAQSALPANLQIPSEPLLKGFADYRVERRDAQSPSALRGCRARSLIHRRRGRRRRFARRLLDCRLRRRPSPPQVPWARSPQAFRTGKARSKRTRIPASAAALKKRNRPSTIASILASTTRTPRRRGAAGSDLETPTASGPAMKSRGPTGSGCRHYEILPRLAVFRRGTGASVCTSGPREPCPPIFFEPWTRINHFFFWCANRVPTPPRCQFHKGPLWHRISPNTLNSGALTGILMPYRKNTEKRAKI